MAKKQSSEARTARRAARGLATAALLSALPLAHAADSLLITAAEYSEDSQYGVLAAIIPFKGSSLGNGWLQRYWVEWLRYEYESNDRTIEAESPGFEAAIGYQKAYTGGYVGGWAGIYYRDIELSPDDPTSENRGSQTRLRVGLDGEQAITRLWRANGIVSYVFGQESYFLRGRLLRSIRGPLSLGAEAILQGDPDYEGTKFGVVLVGLEPFKNANLGLKAGVGRIEGMSSVPYAGVELALPF